MNESGLGSDVYFALAALAWADGFLDDEDAEAIARVAEFDGLDPASLARIKSRIRQRVTLDSIDLARLAIEDRLFVYAVASWMARLDGAVSRHETQVLAEVASLLSLTPQQCDRARVEALEVATSSGRRPKDYDFVTLRRRLGQPLTVRPRP
ncbi:MAG: TerB family tellurite resistance protein [Polyangiaceae bacterium]|nr:TerB family tellurite resistance protein [Polyangiaceae bacterium]